MTVNLFLPLYKSVDRAKLQIFRKAVKASLNIPVSARIEQGSIYILAKLGKVNSLVHRT